MKLDAELLQQLYSPSEWADPQWLALYRINTQWPSRLRNALLLQRADMGTFTLADVESTPTDWLSASWTTLPAAVYIAGATLARNALTSRNMLLRLHYHAWRFVEFSAMIPAWDGNLEGEAFADLRGRDTHALATAAGTFCLLAAWPDLTLGWRRRLRLLLPPEAGMDRPANPAPPLPAAHACRRLLNHTIRFHHAQNH